VSINGYVLDARDRLRGASDPALRDPTQQPALVDVASILRLSGVAKRVEPG